MTEQLNKHIEDKYRGENRPKTRKQKEMTSDQRKKLIQKMLDQSGYKLGIAPMSLDHIQKVEKQLAKKGMFKSTDTADMKRQKTVKSLIRTWSMKYLKMTDDDWEQIKIEDIQLTDNTDIIFVNFKTKDDVTQFTSRAKNLAHDMGEKTPRLVMYVDRRASKRHKAYVNIAKTIREHSNNSLQTSVRTGKNDFLVRSRPKGDNTPWSQIPPIQIVQELPQFEIGMYHDIVTGPGNG